MGNRTKTRIEEMKMDRIEFIKFEKHPCYRALGRGMDYPFTT